MDRDGEDFIFNNQLKVTSSIDSDYIPANASKLRLLRNDPRHSVQASVANMSHECNNKPRKVFIAVS